MRFAIFFPLSAIAIELSEKPLDELPMKILAGIAIFMAAMDLIEFFHNMGKKHD